MSAPESPSALLHRAASLMRERAERAPAAPWRVEPGHLGGMPEYVRSADEADGTVAECWREPGAGEYITGMHPGVAVAVAEWLDLEARMSELRGNSPEGQTFHALKVARAFLGELEPEGAQA